MTYADLAQITSVGGSVFTLLTSAAPSAASNLATQVTSLGGALATIITSEAHLSLVGTKTTTSGGSTFTVATNGLGQVVSTVTSSPSTSTKSGGAAVTKAPIAIAGGVIGAGLAAVALL